MFTIETLLSAIVIILLVTYLAKTIMNLMYPKDWEYYAQRALIECDFVSNQYAWYKDVYSQMPEPIIYWNILRDVEEELEGCETPPNKQELENAFRLLHKAHKLYNRAH